MTIVSYVYVSVRKRKLSFQHYKSKGVKAGW